MKNSFLDYYKEVLEKVSFDRDLLTKEYNKTVQTIDNSEIPLLNQWLKEKGVNASVSIVKSRNSYHH